MKNLVVPIVCLFGLFLCQSVTGQVSFEIFLDSEEENKFYNGNSDDSGNIILVGDIGSYETYDFDGSMIRISPDGDYITKRFDLQDTVSFIGSIEFFEDGNIFIIGAYGEPTNAWEFDHLWIVMLDKELNMIERKSYKVKEPYVGYGATMRSLIDNDGNVVVTTSILNQEIGTKTMFADFGFYKFNQSGDTLLSRYYAYMWNEIPYQLMKIPGSDNLMLIERSTNSNNQNELMQLDPDLNIISINQLTNIEIGLVLQPYSDYWYSDTELLISGGFSINTSGSDDACIGVFRIDTIGNFLQELVLNKIDTADYPAWRHNMAHANDSTIYIGGFQNYLGVVPDPTIVELYMIDKNLNLLGYKELGGDDSYEVWGVMATADDGCLVYGTRNDFPVWERDPIIWKVNREDFEIVTSVSQNQMNANSISVYPNPVVDHIQIQLDNSLDWNGLTLSVFNLNGKKVFQKQINRQGNLMDINAANLKPGYYVLSIYDNQQIVYSTKILKK